MSDRVLRLVPGIRVALGYQRAWLTSDIVAGLVLTAVLVPVGMGYARGGRPAGHRGSVRDDRPAARLCAVRAQPDPGPGSRLVARGDHRRDDRAARRRRSEACLGPRRAGSPSSLAPSASPSGVLRLGLLTDLLSKPIRIGYLNGIALTVFVGQLPKLFGFSVDADGVVAETRGFVAGRHRRPDQPGRAGDRARGDHRHRGLFAGGDRRCPGS